MTPSSKNLNVLTNHSITRSSMCGYLCSYTWMEVPFRRVLRRFWKRRSLMVAYGRVFSISAFKDKKTSLRSVSTTYLNRKPIHSWIRCHFKNQASARYMMYPGILPLIYITVRSSADMQRREGKKLWNSLVYITLWRIQRFLFKARSKYVFRIYDVWDVNHRVKQADMFYACSQNLVDFLY